MSVVLDLREVLLAELRSGLLGGFPAGLGGLDEEFRDHVAERALEAGLDAGATMRAVADAAVALFTGDPEPLPERPVGSPLAATGFEAALAGLAGTAVLINLGGDHAVWSAARAAAGAHGLDPYEVPLDELLGVDELRAAYGAGLDRAAGCVGGGR